MPITGKYQDYGKVTECDYGFDDNGEVNRIIIVCEYGAFILEAVSDCCEHQYFTGPALTPLDLTPILGHVITDIDEVVKDKYFEVTIEYDNDSSIIFKRKTEQDNGFYYPGYLDIYPNISEYKYPKLWSEYCDFDYPNLGVIEYYIIDNNTLRIKCQNDEVIIDNLELSENSLDDILGAEIKEIRWIYNDNNNRLKITFMDDNTHCIFRKKIE